MPVKGGSSITMHWRIGVERPGNALELTHHALCRLSIRQHEVDGTHPLGVQACTQGKAQPFTQSQDQNIQDVLQMTVWMP